jgi:predicted nucleic acid-binding protein
MSGSADQGDVCSSESDDALRRVYGEAAVFTRIGKFTLVHLDAPTEEVIAQRVEEFNPAEFFFDDCCLCVMAKEEGGHILFDGEPPPAKYEEDE